MIPKTERNSEITYAYLRGDSLATIAARYDMSVSNVYRIVRPRVGKLTAGEQGRRAGRHNAVKNRDPEFREKVSAGVQRWWDARKAAA